MPSKSSTSFVETHIRHIRQMLKLHSDDVESHYTCISGFSDLCDHDEDMLVGMDLSDLYEELMELTSDALKSLESVSLESIEAIQSTYRRYWDYFSDCYVLSDSAPQDAADDVADEHRRVCSALKRLVSHLNLEVKKTVAVKYGKSGMKKSAKTKSTRKKSGNGSPMVLSTLAPLSKKTQFLRTVAAHSSLPLMDMFFDPSEKTSADLWWNAPPSCAAVWNRYSERREYTPVGGVVTS